MISSPITFIRKFLILLAIAVLLAGVNLERPAGMAASTATIDSACRFGITSPSGSAGYDIAGIGTGSYLDWQGGGNPDLPNGMEYIRVLRLRNDLYNQMLANLPDWVEAHPGSVWVVGNEPDTTYEHQDGLFPEDYADRFYEVAGIIRNLDPSAKIAFGSVVQPTPIRMKYLNLVWTRLISDAGGISQASALIDIWSIHSFILNEQYGYWGTGIPPGIDPNDPDAVVITDFSDTYSIDIFQQRVIAFRQWMADKGEHNKPLWITEYGSLLPPEDPAGMDYPNVSNQDTANFMVATFDFMMSTQNDQTGFPGDGNHLVQRWFWYSLNDYPYRFGGSLFDPRDKSTTLVGEYFIDYQPLSLAQPDLFPISLSLTPVSYNSYQNLANYRLELKVGNAITANTGTTADVWIYDGNPEGGGTLIAGPITTDIQRCGGTVTIMSYWNEVTPQEEHTLYIQVNPIGVDDSDPSNNSANFSVYTVQPRLTYLSMIGRR